MKLIVGLGNPGKEYHKTRHNVGFIVIDKYLGNVAWKEKFQAFYYKTNIDGNDVIFIKPVTYMNLSGKSVKSFMDYFKIKIEDILIIQDDLDMMMGTYKLKIDTSSGGHNGIKSIEEALNTKSFARLKIGILNELKKDSIDFVLGKMNEEETDILFNNNYNKIIDMFIKEGFLKTINQYKC